MHIAERSETLNNSKSAFRSIHNVTINGSNCYQQPLDEPRNPPRNDMANKGMMRHPYVDCVHEMDCLRSSFVHAHRSPRPTKSPKIPLKNRLFNKTTTKKSTEGPSNDRHSDKTNRSTNRNLSVKDRAIPSFSIRFISTKHLLKHPLRSRTFPQQDAQATKDRRRHRNPRTELPTLSSSAQSHQALRGAMVQRSSSTAEYGASCRYGRSAGGSSHRSRGRTVVK